MSSLRIAVYQAQGFYPDAYRAAKSYRSHLVVKKKAPAKIKILRFFRAIIEAKQIVRESERSTDGGARLVMEMKTEIDILNKQIEDVRSMCRLAGIWDIIWDIVQKNIEKPS